MKSKKEVTKKLESLTKEYDWINKCRQENGLGQKVGCMLRESQEKIKERLRGQIEILEWILR